jgi:serine/threonine-protein kinase
MVPVPSQVVGETLVQAERALRKGGFKVGRVLKQSSSQFAPGQVVTTNPSPGQSASLGSSVNIFVSSGVVVPDVTGESEGQAKSDLHNAGFDNIQTSPQTTSTAAAGTVISENPAGGRHALPSSTTIQLVVAQAPPKATVPTVTGQSAGAATSQLQGDGFTVRRRLRTVLDPTKDGIVLKQNPPGGTRLKKGSTVTIVVGQLSQATTTTTSTTTSTSPTTTTTTTTTTPLGH